jgi:hypothetical protein
MMPDSRSLTYRLTGSPFPSRRLDPRDDTPFPVGGYLAEFVRLTFTIPKDGTRIDDFTRFPRHRQRR